MAFAHLSSGSGRASGSAFGFRLNARILRSYASRSSGVIFKYGLLAELFGIKHFLKGLAFASHDDVKVNVCVVFGFIRKRDDEQKL
jgi:hypothetical protein